MRLTDYTDYALRILMHLGAHPGQVITIREISAAHGISHNHLTKIVHQLGQMGILANLRGRHGGIRLALPPEQIMIGAVIRMTEPDFHMVDCFADEHSSCVLAGRCKLKGMLSAATGAYFEQLDRIPLSALLTAAAAPERASCHPVRFLPALP